METPYSVHSAHLFVKNFFSLQWVATIPCEAIMTQQLKQTLMGSKGSSEEHCSTSW